MANTTNPQLSIIVVNLRDCEIFSSFGGDDDGGGRKKDFFSTALCIVLGFLFQPKPTFFSVGCAHLGKL